MLGSIVACPAVEPRIQAQLKTFSLLTLSTESRKGGR